MEVREVLWAASGGARSCGQGVEVREVLAGSGGARSCAQGVEGEVLCAGSGDKGGPSREWR